MAGHHFASAAEKALRPVEPGAGLRTGTVAFVTLLLPGRLRRAIAMTEDLIYYPARWRHGLLVAIGLAFVAAGVFLVLAEGKWALGLTCIVFFGACTAVGVVQLFDSRPRLRITDAGVLDRTLGVGLIRWADIDGAFLNSLQSQHFICLALHNEADYLARLSPLKRRMAAANQALGFTPISLNLSGVDIDPEQALEYILKQAAATRLVRPYYPLN